MGHKNWLLQDANPGLPHNPETNVLKYLYNYTPEQVSLMMTSLEWMHAMMVHDPKLRFLLAFLEKAINNKNPYLCSHCCGGGNANGDGNTSQTIDKCIQNAQTMLGFSQLATGCDDDH